MTNAHVVAGVSDPRIDDRRQLGAARVVYYNPEVDVAVLAVPTGITAPPLRRPPTAGDGVAILGYPQNGPYDVQAGRVRADQRCARPTSTATAR
jgi:S1-C subfamily serine protease